MIAEPRDVLSYLDQVGLVQWLPALAGLGVGGVIVGWAGAGKARREARGSESDFPPFRTAAHDLETAALIARIPRVAVKQYILLAEAARRYSLDDYENKDGDEDLGAGMVDRDLATVVEGSAEVITQLAWNPWVSRAKYRKALKQLREMAANIDDRTVRRNLASAQYALGRAASPLGELYDEWFSAKKFPKI